MRAVYNALSSTHWRDAAIVRDHLKAHHRDKNEEIEWRGHDVSRLEGFSDAVFGFALALLVVSQQVPYTFTGLMATMSGFISFALCFLFLTHLWHAHYLFFRRYGLIDKFTVRLNNILLFCVLFYVYPLKFLFTLIVAFTFHIAPPEMKTVGREVINPQQFPTLMIFYGLGLAAVFGVFSLLYWHAYRLRQVLKLTETEAHYTRVKAFVYLAVMGTGLLSSALAALRGNLFVVIASYCYLLNVLVPFAEQAAMRRHKARHPPDPPQREVPEASLTLPASGRVEE